jgi:hypothetical protein
MATGATKTNKSKSQKPKAKTQTSKQTKRESGIKPQHHNDQE